MRRMGGGLWECAGDAAAPALLTSRFGSNTSAWNGLNKEAGPAEIFIATAEDAPGFA
jgi:hypothetical protein